MIILLLGLCACALQGANDGASALSWQEQYDLGVRYLSEGNYDEAIIAFTAAIEIDPKQAPAYVGRGDAYVATGKQEYLSFAQADYELALSIDNQLIDIFDKLFSIHMNRGATESALETLQAKYSATGNIHIIEEFINLLDSTSIPPERYIFTSEFVPPEEWTINGVPCWKATPDDIRKVLDGYDVVDVNVGPDGQPVPWADYIGLDVFGTSDHFMWMVDSGCVINADYSTIPTECRGISPGISTEECLRQFGISEIGIKYLQSRMVKMEQEFNTFGEYSVDYLTQYHYHASENTQCNLYFFGTTQLDLDYFEKADGSFLGITFHFENGVLKSIEYRPTVNGNSYG